MSPELKHLCEAVESLLEDAGFQDLAKRAEISETIVRAVFAAACQPISTAPKDEFRGPAFIGLLEDAGGRWQDICCWSGAHQEFMPVSCLPDPTRWREDIKARGTCVTGWWPLPAMP